VEHIALREAIATRSRLDCPSGPRYQDARPLQAQGHPLGYRASVGRMAGSANDDHATTGRQAPRQVLDKGCGCPVAKAHRDFVTRSGRNAARRRASGAIPIASALVCARRILAVGLYRALDAPSGRDDAASGAWRPATKVGRLACIGVRITRRLPGRRRRCCAHDLPALVAHACDRWRYRDHDRNGSPDRQHRDGDYGDPRPIAAWSSEGRANHDGPLVNDPRGPARPRHAA